MNLEVGPAAAPCHLSHRERSRASCERVRGYGLSLGLNPSPELLRNSTPPHGRGGTASAARPSSKFMDRASAFHRRRSYAASASASLLAGAGSGARGRRGSGKSWLS